MLLMHGASTSFTSALASSAIVAAISYAIWKAIYNVLWHPLAAYPGPTLRAAFSFPAAFSKLRGNSYIEIQALHQQYGPVVRLAPDSLSYISKEAWKDIFGLKSDRSELAKDPAYYIRRNNAHILNAKQADHARLRKVIAPCFTDGVLLGQEQKLQKHLDQFVARLSSVVDGEERGRADIASHFNWFAFDVIGELVLGKPLGDLEDAAYQEWIKNVFESIRLGEYVRIFLSYPVIGLAFVVLSQLLPSMTALRKSFMIYSADKIQERKEHETGQQDFIGHVLHGNKTQATITSGELVPNCRILFIAGSETTATHLSGAVWHLLKNPDKLECLQKEIRAAFDTSDEITFSSVNKMERLPYLTAVTQESFRCYPSVPSILPRVTNKEGNVIAGKFVPGNTTVGVHQWSAYRSEQNFYKPEQFLPERWLPDAPEAFANDQRDVLQPFHIGPRGCLGRSLAYFEIRSIMARLLWNFDLKLESESEEWIAQQKEYTLWEKPALWVKVAHR